MLEVWILDYDHRLLLSPGYCSHICFDHRITCGWTFYEVVVNVRKIDHRILLSLGLYIFVIIRILTKHADN